MKTPVTVTLAFLASLLAPGARAEEAQDRPDPDVPKAVTLKPGPGGGYVADAFNFRLGIRSDAPDAERLTLNRYELCLMEDDTFQVILVADQRSRMKDLGPMAWSDLRSVPALTPIYSVKFEERPANLPAQVGHLYAVHVKDPASDFYVVFRVEKLVPGDHCDLTWKRVPSPPPLEAPRNPAVSVSVSGEGKSATISWKPCQGAKGYRILAPGGMDPLVETAECSAMLKDLEPDSVHFLKILAVYGDEDGEASERIPFEVHTHPPGWRSGVFDLVVHEQGFSFTQGCLTDRGPKAELLVVNSGGGATSLTFKARGGLARSGTRGCTIPKERPHSFVEGYRSDSHCPASESFLVRCPGGGLASLRILDRDWPRVRFFYLYRPASDDPGPPDAEMEAGIRKSIARLDDPSFENREKAFAELVRIGPRASGIVDSVLESGASAEVKMRLESWRVMFLLGETEKRTIDGAAEIRDQMGEAGQDAIWPRPSP